jgi:hypothetical protein
MQWNSSASKPPGTRRAQKENRHTTQWTNALELAQSLKNAIQHGISFVTIERTADWKETTLHQILRAF